MIMLKEVQGLLLAMIKTIRLRLSARLFKFWNRWGDKIGKVPPFETAMINKQEQ